MDLRSFELTSERRDPQLLGQALTIEQSVSEADLLAGLRTGDEAAARELVRAHAGPLLSVARRFLDDEDEAQDTVQEAFASAFGAIDGFRGDSTLGTWLHRIVVNAALKRVRKLEQRAEIEFEEWMPAFNAEGHRLEGLPGPVVPVDELLEQREIRDRVRDAIGRLPEAYRAAVLLRDIEGFTTKEAAEALGTSPGALKVRLHRGRSALKHLLEPLLDGEGA